MMKRYDGLILLIPGLLVGIKVSGGTIGGPIIFGTLALLGAVAILLDRAKPMNGNASSFGGAAFIGIAIGLAAMSVGYLLAKVIDYVKTY